MGTRLWTSSIWLVVFVAAITQHGTAGSAACKQECPSTSTSVFHYQNNHKYIYDLEGTTITSLPGTETDVSKLQLKATVELSIQSACSHLVQLKNVQVIGPDAKKYSSLKHLDTSPALVNFQGGVINSQICADEGDSQAALNIKRAVISLLQVATSAGSGSTSITEVDVFGSCPTYISSSKSGDIILVKKLRDLNRCSHREDLNQDIMSTTFVGRADLHSTPLLDSSLEVMQEIKNGVIVSAVSHESYLYRPFSNQGSGAKTTVETKLSLVSSNSESTPVPASINKQRSIIFEAPHESGNTGNSNKKAILSALQTAGDVMKVEVGPTSASKFRALVSLLRHSSKEDILSVYGQVKAGAGFSNKHAARKLLLDALFNCGTGDSVQVAVELIKSHEISSDYSKLWYISFAFVRHATLSSLTAVSTLLDEQNLPREALLGIGALAGRYCREHDCETAPEFNQLINKLGQHLKTKIASRSEETEVIAILKALHNIHHLNDAVAAKVQQISSDKLLSARLRVAALETAQSDACRSVLKKSALDILKDQNEDSEVRIKAYLVLVECPSGTVANNLKELLENEHINQVGSFIVSHLRNLRASTNPSKEEAKQQLGLLRPPKQFPKDIRKFSHNYELSYIIDSINAGTSAETNVIFSQSSFVPRSVSFNTTIDIFGHSYNVLEVSARVENLDHVLESYFGPKGYLKSHDLSDIIKNSVDSLKSYGDKIRERFEHAVRNKRSINQQDLERLKNEVIQSLAPGHDSDDLVMDISLKTFGLELIWVTADSNVQASTPEGIISKIFDFVDEGIDKAKQFDYDLKQHFTFLETELTYPTGLGLPLKLAVGGSSAAHLKTNGQIDIPTLFKNAGSSAVQLEIIPSLEIQLVGSLTIDAVAVESGLKVAYTLHTATGVNVAVKGLNNIGVDVNLGLPLKNQDILTIKTDVLSTVHERGHTEVDTPIQFNINRKKFEGCFDQLSSIIGLTACGEISFPYDSPIRPAAYFPLNGGSTISLKIKSDDVSSFHFKALVNKNDPKHRTVEILFETPGSKIERKLLLLIEGISEPNQEIKISLKSPWKTLALHGIIIDSNAEQSVTAKFIHDDDEYSAKAGVKVSGEPNHQTYSPIIEYHTPGRSMSLTKGGGRKSSQKSTDGYTISGTVTVDKQSNSRKYTFNKVTFNTPKGHYEIDGVVQKEDNLFSNDLKLSYNSQNIVLKSKLQKLSDTHYKISGTLIPSEYKDFALGVTWEYERKKNELKNYLEIIHGSDQKSEDAKITLNQLIHYKVESASSFDISTKNSLTYPILGIYYKFDGSATPKNINYALDIQYDFYKIASELSAKTGVKKPGDYDILFSAQVLNNTLKIKSIRDIISPDQSKFVNVLELIPIVKYDLTSDVTHIWKEHNINQQANSVLKIDGEPNEYNLDVGLILNPQLLDTHAKLGVGSEVYLDSKVLINRDISKPSGTVKILVLHYLDASSSFDFNKGGGHITLNIDIPKIERKIRGKGELTISGTVHVGKLDLHWNADKDPSQKLTIQTTTDIKPESIDSKNTINILDHKTVLNVKGALTGKITDGHLIASGDLILPNGRQLTVKLDRTLHIRQTNSEGRIEIVLVDIAKKGSQPRKLILEAGATNVDKKQLSFDGSGKVEYKSPEGKDIKITINAKNIPQGEKKIVTGEVLFDGSLIPNPIKIKLNSEVSKSVITYKANGGYGSDTSLNLVGTVHTGIGANSQKKIENTIELKLPTEQLKHVKLSTSGSYSHQPDSPCELNTNNVLIWNNDNTLKIDGQLSHDKLQGSGKVVVTLPNLEPRTVAATWLNGDDANAIKKGGSVTLQWDGNKEAKIAGEIELPNDKKSIKLKVSAITPAEKLRTLDLTLSSKISESPAKHSETDIILIVNGETTTISSKVGLAPGVPIIDFTAVHPQGTSKLYYNIEKPSPQLIKVQFNVQWVSNGGGTLDSVGEVRLPLEDFKLVWDIDSPKMKIDKWHVEAAHKTAKGAKRIVFSVKSATSTIIAGSTSVRSKVDGHSVTYDGNGNVEIGDQKERFTFKIQKIQHVQEEHGQTGVEYKANAEIGPKKYEGEWKITNKEFRFYEKVCSKASNCGTIEIGSQVKVADFNDINHELIFVIDLRGLEVPHGISLKANTARHGWNINHEVDLQLYSKNHASTYNIKLITSEKNSALTITLPQRVIALEIISDIKLKSTDGHQKVSFSLWWDKIKKSSLVSSGSIELNQKQDANGLHITGEAKFNNPSLEKELVISGQGVIGGPNKLIDSSLDIDVFKNKNQKISIILQLTKENIEQGYNVTNLLEIKSKGQNLDIVIVQYAAASLNTIANGYLVSYKTSKQPKKELALILDATLEKLNVLVKLPGTTILEIDGTLTKSNDLPVINAEVAVVGLKTLIFHSAVEKKGLVSFSSYIHKKDTPNNKLQVTGGIDNGASLSAAVTSGSDKKELFHVSISTKEEDFLKTDFGWSTENIRKLLELVKHDITEFIKKVKVVITDFITHLKDEVIAVLESLRKSQPNFKRFLEISQQQLQLIRTEIGNDLAMTDITKNIQEVFGAFAHNLEEVIKIIASTLDSIVTVVGDFQTRVIETLKKASPKITEAYTNIINAIVGIIENVLDELAKLISQAADILKAHEEEIKRLVGVVKDLFHDVVQVFTTTIQKVLHELTDFSKIIIDEIKTLPIYSLTKERYAEIINDLSNIQIPDEVLGIIQDLIGPIKESLPTAELKDLLTAIENYIQKKLKNTSVDNKAELEIIYQKLVSAIKSIITLVRSQLSEHKPGTGLLGYKLPFTINSILKLPQIIAIRLSPWSYLTSGDIPSVLDLYYTYRPTLNPFDWIPPFKAYGILVGSNQLFTVDHRHYILQGTCQYILAQDYEDGNFSLILNQEAGQLKSIIITDSTDTIELLADKSLKLNGEAVEYPLVQGDFVAWKRYYSVNIKSKSGVYIHCHTDANICIFHISGFYFGKTRGLLGTINNEPWDDFTLPNGDVVSESSKLGNAWKVNAQCADVSAHQHSDEDVPACTAIFSGDSNLRPWFNVVDPNIFRKACNEHTAGLPASSQEIEACNFAVAYAEICRLHHCNVNVPSQCSQCVIGDSVLAQGTSVSLKVPQRSADIVIIVEQLLENEEVFKELITPLVSTLTNDLKNKGISDVKFSLIGYGAPEQNWPSHYTSNGGKLGFGGGKNIKFKEAEVVNTTVSFDSSKNVLIWLEKKVALAYQHIQLVEAFEEANDYPFRAEAAKTIIGVTSTPCSNNPILESLELILTQKFYRDAGIVVNFVTPVEDIHITGKDEKQVKQIVGFDSNHVYVQSDAKKKVLDGDTELRKLLNYKPNTCLSSTQKTYGAVFNSNNFIAAKASARKQFIQVVSHRIADSLTTHELLKDCICTLKNNIHVDVNCRVSSRKEQQTKKQVKG